MGRCQQHVGRTGHASRTTYSRKLARQNAGRDGARQRLLLLGLRPGPPSRTHRRRRLLYCSRDSRLRFDAVIIRNMLGFIVGWLGSPPSFRLWCVRGWGCGSQLEQPRNVEVLRPIHSFPLSLLLCSRCVFRLPSSLWLGGRLRRIRVARLHPLVVGNATSGRGCSPQRRCRGASAAKRVGWCMRWLKQADKTVRRLTASSPPDPLHAAG